MASEQLMVPGMPCAGDGGRNFPRKVQLVADTKRPSRSMAAFRWVWCSTSKSCEETTQHWHFYVSVKSCSNFCPFEKT